MNIFRRSTPATQLGVNGLGLCDAVGGMIPLARELFALGPRFRGDDGEGGGVTCGWT